MLEKYLMKCVLCGPRTGKSFFGEERERYFEFCLFLKEDIEGAGNMFWFKYIQWYGNEEV